MWCFPNESVGEMIMETVYHTLEPWFDCDSRVLVLGTMPSPKSREFNCYYGHPQNRFWKTLSAVFEEPIPQTAGERKAFVLHHHIALWDVLESCRIRGADDASITKEVPNDLTRILNASSVHTVFTTGAKAKTLYDRYMLPRYNIEAIALPSTSPANRRWANDEQLFNAYRIIQEYI